MKDGIIKGTGDSRYLKGAGWPSTYAEFKAMAEAGTLPFDLNGINEAGWQQIGDALNKGNLLSDAAAAKYSGSPRTTMVDLSTANEGDTIQLPENGKLVDFYVAKKDYESGLNGTGRTLLARKNALFDPMAFSTSNVKRSYNGSLIDTYLNSTYLDLLGREVKSSIGTTTFLATKADADGKYTGIEQLQRAVFILSIREIWNTGSYADGTVLPTASLLRGAYKKATFENLWTRSMSSYDVNSLYISQWYTGSYPAAYQSYDKGGPTNKYCIRPAFTLPNNFTATFYSNNDGNIQEYVPPAGITPNDVFLKNIDMGLKICTLSYEGTGTDGTEASPAVTLTFPFAVDMIIISAYSSTSTTIPISNCVVALSEHTVTSMVSLAPGTTYNGLYSYFSRSEDGKTVSWYGASSSSSGGSALNRTTTYIPRYFVCAIGH